MIKIYTLISLLSLTATVATAQFETGQKIIGGNIGFGTSKYQNFYSGTLTTDNSNVSVSPSFGWFSKPNVLWGISLSYSYNYQQNKNTTNADGGRMWGHNFGINVFTDRFFSLSPNFFFTINTMASAGYGFGDQINTNNAIESELKTKGYNVYLSIAPGLSYRLTSRLLFDAYLTNFINAGYFHSSSKPQNQVPPSTELTQNSFNLSSSLSNTSLGNVGLGFRWLLKNK